MNKVPLHSSKDQLFGYVELFGRLPQFLLLGDELYQRYGQVSNYRYVREPEMFRPNPGELKVELI